MEERVTTNPAYHRAMSALVPARTATYSPVAHSDFLMLLTNKIRNNNMQVAGDRYYTNMQGTKLVGYYTINDTSPMEHSNELGVQMMIGFKNSYDKSMTAALAVGANVIICGNGIVYGDLVSFRRKHTGDIRNELITKMEEAVNSLRGSFGRLTLDIDNMKNRTLTTQERAEILGVMYFENNIVTPTQLSIVKNEIHNSKHFRGDTAWDLYNNITEALKRSHPSRHIEDHVKLHRFMQETVMVEETGDVDYEEIPMDSGSVEG